MEEKIYRIIDANINRSLEGIRVIEDIARFILDDHISTSLLKKTRHLVKMFSSSIGSDKLIGNRNIIGDVGKRSIASETERKEVLDIFRSNTKRLEESIRVLEEFSKMTDAKYSNKFKTARYEIYDIERAMFVKLDKLKKLNFDLYVVSDDLRVLKRSVAAGAKAVQLRIKDKTRSEIIRSAKNAVKMFKGKATVIINDHPDIVKKVGADGVHLGEEQARELGHQRIRKLGESMIVGISASDLKGALKARKLGADYIGFGPVYKTPIKPSRKPTGIIRLKQVVNEIDIPIVAIGGIDKTNIDQIIASGVRRAAVIRAVAEATDTKKAVRQLIRKLRHSA